MENLKYIWLSFRDPKEDKNLGVAVVRADNMMEAITFSHMHGINPGGEALGVGVTQKQVEILQGDGIKLNTFYTPDELDEMKFAYRKLSTEEITNGNIQPDTEEEP